MNRPLLFRAAFSCAALACASALAEDAAPKYSAEAFYQTVDFRIGGPDYAFSPDGKRLIITSDETGVYNAYALDLKTDARTPLTASTASATFAISYFPDGERFLYTADGGGDELNHVEQG